MTDANVVLGFIPPAPLADGAVTVSAERAQEAVACVAEPLGLSLLEAARGIHDIANARMTRALRAVSSERGRDPREFVLVAYGGSGPVHACGLADELGAATILVPALAGLFSSLGLLFARPERHDVRTCHLDARATDASAVEALIEEMAARLAEAAPEEWVRTAELRYEGQSWEVEVEFPEGTSLAELVARFEDEHERLYGVRGQPGSPVQIRALRLAALGAEPPAQALLLNGTAPDRGESRLAHLGGVLVEAPVRTRRSLGAEAEPGPILVDEYDTTVVIPPAWIVRRDDGTGALVLERGRG